GYVTATIYFNRGETHDATHGGPLIAACGGLAALVSGAAGVAMGAACATQAGAVIVQANRADDRRMCLKVKMTWPPIALPTTVIWPDIYDGGYCR
ncbi:MAG: hypothetical protein JWN46_1136, partial [Acidimicrobiales bacterium]|nr:hypothetical protein [Acidimicrobiales bacterium]